MKIFHIMKGLFPKSVITFDVEGTDRLGNPVKFTVDQNVRGNASTIDVEVATEYLETELYVIHDIRATKMTFRGIAAK
jgi:hypothetical protein